MAYFIDHGTKCRISDAVHGGQTDDGMAKFFPKCVHRLYNQPYLITPMMKFSDVLHLTELPYFEPDGECGIRLRDGIIDHIIDSHTHIAWNFFFGRPVDQKKIGTTQHFFPNHDAAIDLTHYSAHDVKKPLLRRIRRETMRPVITTRGLIRTHTAANMLKEMKSLSIETSVVLAIDEFGSKNSDVVLTVAHEKPKNFVPYVSLPPRSLKKWDLLSGYVKQGARGIKIHPPMQLVRPNSRFVREIAELAEHFSLPILFHCGHTPLSPRWQQKYTQMEDYEKIVALFPKVTFILGHSGVDRFEEAARIGKKYENVYLELSGQPPQAIKKIISIMGSDKLLFGSDWPYYPVALPLAKVLLATEGNDTLREKLLYTNSKHLLQKSR